MFTKKKHDTPALAEERIRERKIKKTRSRFRKGKSGKGREIRISIKGTLAKKGKAKQILDSSQGQENDYRGKWLRNFPGYCRKKRG